MKLSESQRREVASALDQLNTGDRLAFEWSLWVGLGDVWVPVRDALISGGYVTRSGSRGDGLALTPRGDAIRKRMSERAAATTAVSGAGDGNAASTVYALAAV